MEVEIKLRLLSAEAHATIADALSASHKAVYEQENFFFDGIEKELSSKRAVLRVRFYNQDEKAVITVKGKQILKDGIGRATEQEEGVAPALARTFLETPDALLNLDSELMKLTKSAYGIKGLTCLGGFANTRQVYEWKGHQLELDRTKYPWGTLYEIECETDKPEQLRAELEAFLGELGAPYKYSTTTKFANFINQTLE